MSTRKNWVPLHSIIVERDGKLVDALEEHRKTGKAFAFTESEIEDIERAHGGTTVNALRSPVDEAATIEAEAKVETSTVMSAGTDTAPVAGKTIATPAPKGGKAAANKDTDL